MPQLFNRVALFFTFIAICLPAVQPLFNGQMPRTDDGTIHLYRVVVLDHSIRVDGTLWPRYSSGLVYGYGAPLFNYFPPTAYYPAVALHQLGLSYVQSWTTTMALWLLIAAGGVFWLGRIWSNGIGGIVSAIAYLYAPYLLFDVFTRGTLTEVAALAILPWTLWAFTRLSQHGRRLDFALAVGSFALFIPIHNIVTLHGTLLLMTYCMFLWLSASERRRGFAQMASAGVLAVALTAFFWLPALGETGATKLDGVVANLDFIDPTNTLRPITEILAPPQTYDPTQQQQAIPITLGWPQLALASIGFLLAFARRREQNLPLAALLTVLALVVAITVLIQTPQAAWAWEQIPLLDYSQFAWRIMGLPSLALALMAGMGAALLLREIASKSRKMALICVFYASLVVWAMPWLYAPYFAPHANSIRDAQTYERETGELALSSFSEYLPFWNQAALNPDGLRDRFELAEVIPRLQSQEGMTIVEAEWRGTAATLHLDIAQATTLVFDWLYMPSWFAEIDGNPVSVEPTVPEGFVSVVVPSGQYTLHMGLTATPLQQTAHIISALALVALLLVLRLGWHIWQASPSVASATQPMPQIWLALAGVALAVLGFKTLVIDTIPNPLRSAGLVTGQIVGLENTLNADLGGLIRLLGYEIVKTIPSGAEGQIWLFWTLAGEQIEPDLSSSVHLRDAQGNLITQTGSFTPAGTATSNWLRGFYLLEDLTLAIPDYTPPRRYALDVGLFNSETLVGLDVLNELGNPIGQRVPLGELQVTHPDIQPAWEGNSQSFGAVDLLEVAGLPDVAQVGATIELAWLWRLEQVTTDHQATLLWRSAEGVISATASLPLVEDWPTTEWRVGEIWRGHHQIFVPGNLHAGDYDLALQVGSEDPIVIAQMQITEPERSYDLPDQLNPIDSRWANGIHLSGYNLSDNEITLYWQSAALLNESLNLFVQVVDDSDQIVALTDGVPLEGLRPTTSWDMDEVVATTHLFEGLEEGTYQVRVGWYQPRTGQRVQLNEEGDSIFLPESFQP